MKQPILELSYHHKNKNIIFLAVRIFMLALSSIIFIGGLSVIETISFGSVFFILIMGGGIFSILLFLERFLSLKKISFYDDKLILNDIKQLPYNELSYYEIKREYFGIYESAIIYKKNKKFARLFPEVSLYFLASGVGRLLDAKSEDIRKLIETSSANQACQQINNINTKNLDSKEYIEQINDEDKEANLIYLAFIPLAIMLILFYIFAWK